MSEGPEIHVRVHPDGSDQLQQFLGGVWIDVVAWLVPDATDPNAPRIFRLLPKDAPAPLGATRIEQPTAFMQNMAASARGRRPDDAVRSSTDPRAQQLLDEATAMLSNNQPAAALRLYESAEVLLRERHASQPEDADASYDLGRLLYSKASSLTGVDRTSDAITALDECEQLYTRLREHGRANIEPLVADVCARRGVANARRHLELSAVADFDRAVCMYASMIGASQASLLQWYSDYARILSLTARNSGACLDSDLAVACADRAIAMYMSPQRPDDGRGFSHATYLSDALAVASETHGAHRRFEIALQAGELGVWVERRRLAEGQPYAQHTLCAALARLGVHMRAAGDGRAEKHLAEARALDAAQVERAFERWRWVEDGSHPALNTLENALSTAAAQLGRARVGEHLATTLLSDPVMRPDPGARVIFVPSKRCDPQIGAVVGLELAELAQQMMSRDLDCAYRLAVEAHGLFLAASRAQTFALRYRFAEFGEPWARMLLATSRHFQAAGELGFARDAAHWGFAAVMRLRPFTYAAEGGALEPLTRECCEQYVDTLTKAGAFVEAAEVRSTFETASSDPGA